MSQRIRSQFGVYAACLVTAGILIAFVAALPLKAATFTVPVPTVTPLPITEQSYPWLYHKYTQRPLDLEKAGFVEEEYLVSGTTNVYDWDPDPMKDLIVKYQNAPYATRILVRRPADMSRFTGTVVVETMNPARGFDMAIMFGWVGPRIMERGDAWIGVTVSSNVLTSLKRFDAARYERVGFPNPAPPDQRACAAPAGGGGGRGRAGGGGAAAGGRGGGQAAAPNPNENGLRLGALAQIGTWVRSRESSNPFTGRVQHVFLIGHTGGDVATYVSSMGAHARLDDGRPIYDGFIAHSGSNAGALVNCGRGLANDPRAIPGRAGVPMIVMKAQNDLPYAGRPDSDDPNDVFRVYDMPAAAHADWYLFRWLPLVEQQRRISDRVPVTDQWAFDSNCSIPHLVHSTYPQGFLINGALENLERYAKDKTPLPRAPRVPMIERAGEEARPQLDEYGNAVGGVRTPYLDAPVATFHAPLTGANATCAEMVHEEKWPWHRALAVHGSFESYRQKVEASIQKLVQDRWIVPSDGEKMRKDLLGDGTLSRY